MSRKAIFSVSIAAACLIAVPPAFAQTTNCEKFREAMARTSGDLKADFVRPLVVSRGGPSGLEQFDLTSSARIDGVLRCNGDAFVSFEATIHMPADRALIDKFAIAQTSAFTAVAGWSQSHARDKVRSLAHEAADYLRGSVERGDVAVSGKLEEHLPGGIDVGIVWTPTERTFVLLTGG